MTSGSRATATVPVSGTADWGSRVTSSPSWPSRTARWTSTLATTGGSTRPDPDIQRTAPARTGDTGSRPDWGTTGQQWPGDRKGRVVTMRVIEWDAQQVCGQCGEGVFL